MPAENIAFAALYIDSFPNCRQIVTGDSPCSLGSSRPSVSEDVVRHVSSRTRTVDRGERARMMQGRVRTSEGEEAR